MDMLDQALDNSSQDKGNDSDSGEASQMQSDSFIIPHEPEQLMKGEIICCESGVSISSEQLMTVQEQCQEGVEEQTAAIASVAPQGGLLDPTVQYQFRAENGQGGAVTYRVVQVAPNAEVAETGGQVVTTASAALVGQQVAQAIITSPFTATNGGASPTGEAGQFYVMMTPSDVLQTGQRALAPRTHQFSPKVDGNRTARDERRRATHNEVERRRRDKINNWIIKLSKIVPECASEHNKSGQSSVHLHSKGGILAKACDYIQELRSANSRLPEILKENERLTVDVELLRQQCDELKAENLILKAHLQQHGITVTEIGPGS